MCFVVDGINAKGDTQKNGYWKMNNERMKIASVNYEWAAPVSRSNICFIYYTYFTGNSREQLSNFLFVFEMASFLMRLIRTSLFQSSVTLRTNVWWRVGGVSCWCCGSAHVCLAAVRFPSCHLLCHPSLISMLSLSNTIHYPLCEIGLYRFYCIFRGIR